MGIFLGLGNAQLGQSLLADILAKGIGQILRLIGHLHIGHGGIVLGHADIHQREEAFFAPEPGKIGVHQRAGQLTCPVGAEVEEDHAVPASDGRVFRHHRRHGKFIGHTVFIVFPHHRHRVGCLYALAVHHGVIGFHYPLPAVVPVHGVVAAAYGGYLAHADLIQLRLQLINVLRPGGRGHITPIHKAVDIYLFHTALFRHLYQAIEVPVVAVHPAVG